jgi:hypothetical protein
MVVKTLPGERGARWTDPSRPQRREARAAAALVHKDQGFTVIAQGAAHGAAWHVAAAGSLALRIGGGGGASWTGGSSRAGAGETGAVARIAKRVGGAPATVRGPRQLSAPVIGLARNCAQQKQWMPRNILNKNKWEAGSNDLPMTGCLLYQVSMFALVWPASNIYSNHVFFKQKGTRGGASRANMITYV